MCSYGRFKPVVSSYNLDFRYHYIKINKTISAIDLKDELTPPFLFHFHIPGYHHTHSQNKQSFHNIA